jgi:hypothetical protein
MVRAQFQVNCDKYVPAMPSLVCVWLGGAHAQVELWLELMKCFPTVDASFAVTMQVSGCAVAGFQYSNSAYVQRPVPAFR